MQPVISIDPSLSSTAIVVRNCSEHYFCFFKGYSERNKWCVQLQPFVTFQRVDYDTAAEFSANELLKLQQYRQLVDNIVTTLQPFLHDSRVKIESYSQQSKNGRYQDLVTFGTLLRDRLLDHCATMQFVAPKQLKKLTAGLVYGYNDGIARNTVGIAGGSFDKWDMFNSIVELADDSALSKYCVAQRELIAQNKSVPKPLEDLIDAYFLNLIWICLYLRLWIQYIVGLRAASSCQQSVKMLKSVTTAAQQYQKLRRIVRSGNVCSPALAVAMVILARALQLTAALAAKLD